MGRFQRFHENLHVLVSRSWAHWETLGAVVAASWSSRCRLKNCRYPHHLGIGGPDAASLCCSDRPFPVIDLHVYYHGPTAAGDWRSPRSHPESLRSNLGDCVLGREAFAQAQLNLRLAASPGDRGERA